MCSRLGQMLAILLKGVQHLLLLLKFALMLSAHIALMLELYLQSMDTLQCLTYKILHVWTSLLCSSFTLVAIPW